MKNLLNILTLVLLSFIGISQELSFDVRSMQSNPILSEQLNKAQSMSDLMTDYPSSWIKESEYVSSEIQITADGKQLTAIGENDKLNTGQMDLLKRADIGTSINVEVKYNFKNSITQDVNVKTMKFSLTLVPAVEAEFPGGKEILKNYLKASAIKRLDKTDIESIKWATVTFLIGEDGKVFNSRITKTSDDDKIDQLLLRAIDRMPNWKPAANAAGKNVMQEFEFNVGSMIRC